ncbi:MAG: hypothetical protein MMC33_001605 [Icmadophila ericetorum]|nr:hypothetical protein [Icmadophila ericetorum]
MQQRKDEIQAKKARLAELKRQRELRQREFSQQRGSTPELAAPTPRVDSRKDLDIFISSVLGEASSSVHTPSAQSPRPGSSLSRTRTPQSAVNNEAQLKSHQVQTPLVATQTLSTTEVSVNFEITPASTKTTETLTYSAATQTTEPWYPERRNRSTDGYSDSDRDLSPSKSRTPKASKRLSRREREREEELRQRLRQEIEEEIKAVQDSNLGDPKSQDAPKFPARELTGEEMKAVTSSEDFLDFIERSSKVIERALEQDYNVLADYALDGLNGADSDSDSGYASSRNKKGRKVKEIAQFYDERWNRKRMISDIDFSPKFPELLLSSSTKNPSAPQDPSGLLQIWNLHLHSRPEYVFHAPSDILVSKFSPFHTSLILGGTYSGQVLLWDTRSRSPLPVQKTPLTGASGGRGGHTHPIYSLEVVGTQNANNIISCSTDGVVCGWTVDMLSQPQEYLDLYTPPPSKTEDLSPTCMAFPPSDPTSFLVGTEEGALYPCHRYDRAGAKAGVDNRLRYRGHAAPVMSVDFHPLRGPLDLSDLFITSSLDWSVKIWKVRAPSSVATGGVSTPTTTTSSTGTFSASVAPLSTTSTNPANLAQTQEISPVLDIPREDLIYSAKWSPTRPSIFACVDGAGYLEIWDLLSDIEVPVQRVTPSSSKKPSAISASGGGVTGGGLLGGGARSLNKVAWEEKEGRRIAVGGAGGVVTVFEVGMGLGGEGEGREEWVGTRKVCGGGGKK